MSSLLSKEEIVHARRGRYHAISCTVSAFQNRWWSSYFAHLTHAGALSFIKICPRSERHNQQKQWNKETAIENSSTPRANCMRWDVLCLPNVHTFLSLHSLTELPSKACWTWRSSDQLSWSQGVETLTSRIPVTVQIGHDDAPKAMWATCRAFSQAVGLIIPQCLAKKRNSEKETALHVKCHSGLNGEVHQQNAWQIACTWRPRVKALSA